MSAAMKLGAGLALGAGLMYWLDPQSGRRRRAYTRDQAIHLVRRSAESLDVAARDVEHRLHGLVASARGAMSGEQPTDDVLRERVRSKLGRLSSHPGAIEVRCESGRVELEGHVLAREERDVIAGVRAIPGVKGLRVALQSHATADTPALQGGHPIRRVQGPRSPIARLLLVGGGLVLTSLAVPARGVLKLAPLAAGLGLVSRAIGGGVLGRTLFPFAPRGPRERGAFTVHKTMTVNAPPDEVYAFWNRPENFPRFMRHVREVKRTGDGRYHWKVEGPTGIPFEWDAIVTDHVPSELLAWKSTEGSSIMNAGVVRFEPVGDGKTRVTVRMAYRPPAGALGHTIAKLFGADPKREMDDDLLRLKSLLERGQATGPNGPVRKTDLLS